MRKSNLVVVMALVLAGLACNFSLGANRCKPNEDIMYQDDFSDTGSGWDRFTDDTGATDYQDGGYHILVDTDASALWANPGCDFTDVSVEVDGHKIGGVDDNEYGMICRYQDVDNFIGASISSDGFYGFLKVSDGTISYISDGMLSSDAILQGSATNHIQLDCVGNSLTLFVNGTFVDSITDDEFSSGDVGLYAGSFDTPGVDIWFDNFKVSKP